MQTLAIGSCVLVAAASLQAQAPAPSIVPAPSSADETSVRAVIDRYVAARDGRDAQAIETLFAADADQLTTAGEWRRGRTEIVEGTARSSAQNPGARSIRIETVRFLSPDVALADGPYEIDAAGTAATRRMRTSIVLVRRSEGWRIAAIRNMTPTRPMP